MESNKVKIRTSKSDKNYFHFQFGHGTTNKFMEPCVPMIMEVVKDSELKIKTSVTRRIDPMPLPPMSTVKFNTRFYFVPMIDICPYFKDFDEQTPYAYRYSNSNDGNSSTIPLQVPGVRSSTFIQLLFGTLYFSQTELLHDYIGGSSDYLILVACQDTANLANLPDGGYDLRVNCVDSANNFTGQALFRFSSRGRNFYKLIKQLGYDFTMAGFNLTQIGIDDKSGKIIEFSALPLFAFAKVFLSYYENSAFIDNNSRLKIMNSMLHCDYPGYQIKTGELDIITDMTMYMTYERDYFTTSFVNPVGGNNIGVNSLNYEIIDPTLNSNSARVITNESGNGTPTFSTATANSLISATGIKLLQRLSNFMKKYQIIGGRMVDRMLAEYGVSTTDGYSRRTSYVDGIQSVMTISPVLNTTSEQLGDYAGYGQSGIDGDKNEAIIIKSNENSGYVIAIDTIVPEIFYSQGYNRNNRHLTKFDFHTPAFDAVGVQSTEVGEIYCTHQGIYDYVDSGNPSTMRFGYKPRYSEYKEKVSYLTGDFICDSVNKDIDAYFTDRRFHMNDYLDSHQEIDIHFGNAFASTYDNVQYNRIFYYNEYNTDYIKSIFRFDIEMTAPMLPIYDEYKMDDENGSEEVTMEVGGQTMT